MDDLSKIPQTFDLSFFFGGGGDLCESGCLWRRIGVLEFALKSVSRSLLSMSTLPISRTLCSSSAEWTGESKDPGANVSVWCWPTVVKSDYIRDGGSVLSFYFPSSSYPRERGGRAGRVDQTNYFHSDGREDLVGADCWNRMRRTSSIVDGSMERRRRGRARSFQSNGGISSFFFFFSFKYWRRFRSV